MNVVCIVPPLHFSVNEYGHGYQPPLGLLSVAGPLIDAGFQVSLIDADAAHLTHYDVIVSLKKKKARIVLIGHSGSIVANPAALELMSDIKEALPNIICVYGGVYATYACRHIMVKESSIDFIISGEGEKTTLELLEALKSESPVFGQLEGLVWRSPDGNIVSNPMCKPIENLNHYRVAWELADWELYPSRHLSGRGAIVQFSRGCPHTCTYCGQWMFWKRWRHKNIDKFIDELELLRTEYDVRTIWMADENIGHDQEIFHTLLLAIRERDLGISIFCALTAEDVVRDADKLHLYHEAGIVCLMMGVESFEEKVLNQVKKNNSLSVSYHATRLLRENHILSVMNVIFGLQDETWKTLFRTYMHLRHISPDYLNALHFTPIGWTSQGKNVDPKDIIQSDQRKWDFRLPVVNPRNFSPKGIAIIVKLIEALFYFRPSWFISKFFYRDSIIRKIVFNSMFQLLRVYLIEWKELLATSFVNRSDSALEKTQLDLLMPRKKPGRKGNTVDRCPPNKHKSILTNFCSRPSKQKGAD